MNEEVAKTRVCPIFELSTTLALFGMGYMKTHGSDAVTAETLAGMKQSVTCRGSNCMMWRRAMPGYGGYCGLGGNISNE